MTAKPYTPEQVEAHRKTVAGMRAMLARQPRPMDDYQRAARDAREQYIEREETWLATVDATLSHARERALGEAVKVAETHYLQPCPNLCGQSIATAIRALRPPKPTTREGGAK